MIYLQRLCVLLIALLFFSSPAQGQQSPAEYLGYELGTEFTLTHQLEEYYRYLAEHSPRVEYKSYGESVTGRDLPMLFVSSEENLNNKEQIKKKVKKLTKRTKPLPNAEVKELASTTPSVFYIYVLDAANEFPGIEGSMQIAYDLATREDSETKKIRDELLVIMSPMTNPDAHAKTVEWLNIYDVPGSSVDPNTKQNNKPWGLQSDGNVWGIDINRDFTWFVTPETRAMAKVSVEWQPQTVLDLHCCPPVFFMTPTGPPDHPMWPKENRKWSERSVELAQREFGNRGFSMSSGMDYAGITYLGHGLTWGLLGPNITGQMFESIGGFPAVRRSDGSVATVEMGIKRHVIGTWAVMKNISTNKQELLTDAYNISVNSAEKARKADVRGAVIPASGLNVDQAKLKRLLDRLDVQGIEIKKATEPFTVESRPFMNLSSQDNREFPAGTYYIDFVQPYSRLARAVLDPTLKTPVPKVDPRNNREEPFYDSQVQNLPLLFGVNAYTIDEEPPSVQNEVYDSIELQGQVTSISDSPYGYILPAGKEASYKVAIDLMQDDYNVRVFKGPFEHNGTRYDTGTFGIISNRNGKGLDEKLNNLVKKYGADLIEVADPINAAGIDFGNADLVAHIPNPLVAVLADDPAEYGDIYAGIRTALEVDFNFTFSSVRKEVIERGDLSKYSAIVLPHGRNYEGALNLDNVREYVQNGGTVIAAKNAGLALSKDSTLGKNITFKERADQTFGTIMKAEWVTHNSPAPGEWVDWEPGIEVDRPLLSVGFEDTFAARGANVLLYDVKEDSDARVLAHYTENTDELLLDGFMVDDDKKKIAGKPYVVDHPVGRGNVIYLTETINYRGYWYGNNLIFLNSLLFGPVR